MTRSATALAPSRSPTWHHAIFSVSTYASRGVEVCMCVWECVVVTVVVVCACVCGGWVNGIPAVSGEGCMGEVAQAPCSCVWGGRAPRGGGFMGYQQHPRPTRARPSQIPLHPSTDPPAAHIHVVFEQVGPSLCPLGAQGVLGEVQRGQRVVAPQRRRQRLQQGRSGRSYAWWERRRSGEYRLEAWGAAPAVTLFEAIRVFLVVAPIVVRQGADNSCRASGRKFSQPLCAPAPAHPPSSRRRQCCCR